MRIPRPIPRRPLWRVVLPVLGAIGLACVDGGGPAGPRTPSRLELQFGDSGIELGTQRRVFSLVRAADGTTIYDITYRWRADDSTVVRVDEKGVVYAVGLGRTVVRAEVRRDTAQSAPPLVSATVIVRVTPRVVRRVLLDRDSVTIAQQGTVTLIGTPEAEDRTALPERTVAWRSTAPAVATVAADGTVTGLTAGSTQIIASSEGFADTATVTVSTFVGGVDVIEIAPLPDTLPLGSRWTFAATLRTRDGRVLTDRRISWSLQTVRGIDVGQLLSDDTLEANKRGVLKLIASSEGRRAERMMAVDEPFVREVSPIILLPYNVPNLRFDDSVRVLVTSNSLAPLAQMEFFLDYRPVPVFETVLAGRRAQRAWEATIKLEAWPFGLLRFEAIGTDSTGRRGIAVLIFERFPAEPKGGPLPGGGRR